MLMAQISAGSKRPAGGRIRVSLILISVIRANQETTGVCWRSEADPGGRSSPTASPGAAWGRPDLGSQ